MNDSEDLKKEDLLTMMEQMQDQLDLEKEERSKAQEKISTLSSENSRLRRELQKKSETIVSLNEKIESLSKSDLQLQKSEAMMQEALKLQREAEDKVSACNRRAEILTARESKVSDREDNLDREIKSKAENMIKSDRQRLEWEYKEHKGKASQEYKSKATAITKKYDTMTKTYYVELASLVLFSLIATISQVWKEPVIAEDTATFFSGLWNIVVTGYGLTEYAGHSIASVTEAIENPTAAAVLYWVICILVIVAIIGAVGAGIVYVIYRYATYIREHQWDRHTVIAVVADLAVTMFLAGEIKSVIPVNVILMQILIFLGYSGGRAWIVHIKGNYP